MKFTNKNVLKEEKKIKRGMIIGIALIVVSFGLFYFGNRAMKKADNNIKDMNSIIESSDSKKDGLETYLNIKKDLYRFAVYDDTSDAYYFVTDGDYIYIVYMSVDKYKEISNDDSDSEYVKVKGVTSTTTKDVKEIAVDSYNEIFELSDGEEITMADFNNYFGSVYLDMTNDTSDAGGMEFLLGIIVFFTGLVCFLTNDRVRRGYKKSLKKYTDSDIEAIDNEMDDKESFYYDKSKLYLTPHYIINFSGKFSIIKYSDILWVYPYAHRTNGIKDTQSIIVKDKFGKNYVVANLSIITKAKKEEFNEIMNTIISKNDKMLVGYNSENAKKYKEIIKLNKEM